MEASGLPAIADDSGLCVDALNGAPACTPPATAGRGWTTWAATGFAGEHAGAAGPAVPLCLRHLLLLSQRGPGGGRGVSRHLGLRPQGEDGFGYDPIFFVPALKRPLRSSLRRRRTPSPTGECAHGLSGEAGAVSEQVKCPPAGGQIKRRPVYGRTDKQAAGPAQGPGQQH